MTTPRVTVPVEPTADMMACAEQASQMLEWQIKASWSAMLSAAPAPEGGAVKDWDAIRSHPCYDEHQPGCDCSALATREEAPAEAGEREAIARIIDPTGWRAKEKQDSVGAYSDYQVAESLTKADAILALRAQPQDREDAQPVGWQRRIRNTAVPSSDPKSQWSKWADCDDRQRKDVKETGGIPGFPELIAEVRPIYTHPAPDALRVAVEALGVISRASARSETMFGGKMSEITRVFQNITRVSDQALAALQAEQGAK